MSYESSGVVRKTARCGVIGIAMFAVSIVIVVLLASMAIFGFGMFQRGTANFRGQTDAIGGTLNYIGATQPLYLDVAPLDVTKVEDLVKDAQGNYVTK